MEEIGGKLNNLLKKERYGYSWMFTSTAKKTVEGEGEEKKGTHRSIVYTVAVLVQLIWMIFLLWEIAWIFSKNLNVDMDHPSWGVEVVVS